MAGHARSEHVDQAAGATLEGVGTVTAEMRAPVEAAHLPRRSRSLEQLAAIRAAAEAAGVSSAVAAGLVAWLAAGGGDGGNVSKATRSRYRAVLRDLEESGRL